MSKNLNSQTELLENNPEVTSYIYQQITEFEPYISSETVFAVVAKDPTQLENLTEIPGDIRDKKALKKMFRISMSLTENGTTIEAEGVASDIFSAIKQAREKLSVHLAAIHDSMVSQKEREKEIETFMSASLPKVVH